MYPFPYRVVSAHRTFWEKAMLLHEENFRLPEKRRKPGLARHYYDLWCMIKKGVADKAMRNDELFQGIVEHRKTFFQQAWLDYDTLKRGTLRIVPPDDQISYWRNDYKAIRYMFFGDIPEFDDMINTVRIFEETFNGPREK